MHGLELLALATSRVPYLLPLLVSVSLTYAATRHEHLGLIVRRALFFCGWILLFMAVVFAILHFVSRDL